MYGSGEAGCVVAAEGEGAVELRVSGGVVTWVGGAEEEAVGEGGDLAGFEEGGEEG